MDKDFKDYLTTAILPLLYIALQPKITEWIPGDTGQIVGLISNVGFTILFIYLLIQKRKEYKANKK